MACGMWRIISLMCKHCRLTNMPYQTHITASHKSNFMYSTITIHKYRWTDGRTDRLTDRHLDSLVRSRARIDQTSHTLSRSFGLQDTLLKVVEPTRFFIWAYRKDKVGHSSGGRGKSGWLALPRESVVGSCALRSAISQGFIPVSVKQTVLLRGPLPCIPAAETTLQPLNWCSESPSSQVSFSREDCFVIDTSMCPTFDGRHFPGD